MTSCRNIAGILVLAALLSACADRMMNAGLFAARVEDTLGRPLEGARVRIVHWEAHGSNERLYDTEVTLATITTNALGFAFATWPAVDLSEVDPRENPDYATELFVEVEKAGYIGYSTDNRQHRYTLAREITRNDFDALAELSGERLHAQVRELLAGQFLDRSTDTTQYWLPHARQVHGVLLSLVQERRIAWDAVWLVAKFGFPQDVGALVAQREKLKFADEYDGTNLCGVLVPALLSPQSSSEWDVLRACLYDGEPQDVIQTLLLNGSEQAKRMLLDYRSDNPWYREGVKRALDRFGRPRMALTGESPEVLVDSLKKFLSQEPADVYSHIIVEPSGEFALAGLGVPECSCTYGATFHRVGDRWVLRRLGIDWMQ